MPRALHRSPFLLLLALSTAARAGQVELISRVHPQFVADTGSGPSEARSISADGRYAVFLSKAPNLFPGQVDVNFRRDVFVYDRVTGTTELVSRSAESPTATGNGQSSDAAISRNGRYVVFSSTATDLVPGQQDSSPLSDDVFLYDRITQTTELVSHASSSRTQTSSGYSRNPAISADGRYIAFVSFAPDLIEGQVPADRDNVWLYDRISGKNELVSHAASSLTTAADGIAGTFAVSVDGSVVAFSSQGSNYVNRQVERARRSFDVFLYSRATGRIALASGAGGSPTVAANAPSALRGLSADGNRVLLQSTATNLARDAADANRTTDVFLYDRRSGRTELVSRSAASPNTTGNAGSYGGAFSADGRFVAFQSLATDLVPGSSAAPDDVAELFLYDRQTGSMTRVGSTVRVQYPPPPAPAISADGSFVAFTSTASDLVPGQIDENGSEDIFLYDRAAGTTTLISRVAGTAATAGEGRADGPALSADGRFITFETRIGRSVYPGLFRDVFLHDRVTGTTTLVSRTADSPTTGVGGTSHVISPDGRFVAFRSTGTNLVPGQVDQPGTFDLFLYDRLSGVNTLVTHTQDSAVTAAGDGGATSFSADGRFLPFASRPTWSPGSPTFIRATPPSSSSTGRPAPSLW